MRGLGPSLEHQFWRRIEDALNDDFPLDLGGG
jgi:hypothetical protein